MNETNNQQQFNTVEELQAELERVKEANKAFIRKVAKLRDLQKEYFKTRSHDTLRQSKALESEVDKFINRCFEKMAQQDIEFQDKVEIIKDKFDAEPCQPTDQQ